MKPIPDPKPIKDPSTANLATANPDQKPALERRTRPWLKPIKDPSTANPGRQYF